MDKKITIPEFLNNKVHYQKDGTDILSIDKRGGFQKILDLRGWGAIQNLFQSKGGKIDFESATEFQDELGQFITDAINEKLEAKTKVMKLKQKLERVFKNGDTLNELFPNELNSYKEEKMKYISELINKTEV